MTAVLPSALTDAGAVAAVIIAIFGAARLVARSVTGTIRSIGQELDDRIAGHVAPVSTAVDAVRSDLTEHRNETAAFRDEALRRLTSVESQLHPNGGSSLRDQTDRIEAAIADGTPAAD